MSSGFGKAAATTKDGKAKAAAGSGGKASKAPASKASGGKSTSPAGGGIKAAKALAGSKKDVKKDSSSGGAGSSSSGSEEKKDEPSSPAGSGAKAVLALKEGAAAEAAAPSAEGAAAAPAPAAARAPAAAPAAEEEVCPPAPAPAPEPVIGKIHVRYNHYNEEFDLKDGVLEFEPIDKAYCISYVFKGEWTCYLTDSEEDRHSATKVYPDGGFLQKEMRPDPDGFNSDDEEEVYFGTFSGLELVSKPAEGEEEGGSKPPKKKQYVLNVDEDPADANKPKTVYKAASSDKGRVLGGDDEDAVMGLDKASCSCLFGNPCAVPENCKDWHNRFDVAKKNGWKGFS